MQETLSRRESPVAFAQGINWFRLAAGTSAVLLGFIFLVSGGWKMLQPFMTGELLEEAKVPDGYGALGAAALGTLEVLASFLLFTPRYRRWGGLLGSALLIFFIGWVAFYYDSLVGQECKCFPFIKRAVNPMFFVGDSVMLLLGLAAFVWSPRVKKFVTPVVALAILALISSGSYAWNRSQMVRAQIPTPVIVDGKPVDLSRGKVFVFFYDPSCMHCDAAARFMSGFDWQETRVVSIPTVNPQWAASFLHDTKLKAGTSLEVAKLRKTFTFVDAPYGVALKNGVVKETFGQAAFTAPSPKAQLETLGFVK